MKKITLKIEGMACNMCEAHMNETVRKCIPGAVKVSSSFRKGETVFVSETVPDKEVLKNQIDATGYVMTDMKVEEYVKKGLFGLW